MLLRILAIFLLLAVTTPSKAAEKMVAIPHFVEETAGAGIQSIYAGEWQYMVGGGVATFDCNADGFPDILLAGGEKPAKFYRNTAKRGGALHFEAQTSGLELEQVTGAYPLDVDSDGITDIALLRVGENVLMRGLGDCRFERANEAWGFVGGDAWTAAFAATWEHGATWPSLAIGNYIDRNEEISPWGSCTDNWLHRPRVVDGKTQAKFADPMPLKPSYCALSMLFTDWNRSGTPSLRVSNDREYYEGGQEQLWHVDAFKPPALYTEAEGWKPLRIWGMGIAAADLNFDGYPEYFLTSMADSKLQTLVAIPPDGKPAATIKDIAYARGVTAHRPSFGTDLRPSTGWHAEFADVNNDGLVDLFIAKGNVDQMPDFAKKDPNNLFLQSPDGKFQDAAEAAGVASVATSRGAALVDFNLDGQLDLVVVNRRENAQLWRNTTANAGAWTEVRLKQPGVNRDGVGAFIEIKNAGHVIRREITSGGGHASGESGWWHFGLGDAADFEIRVIWPEAPAGDWQKLKANAFYVFSPGKTIEAWLVKE